ncbi:hypothetical protein [Giesbergeria anulus]|uniref:Uncharacterized protein n=1 Tax=Giesbergeria anulus TaxID=180197 RepID=A0A1H9NTF7_9BURK|nr:hypothetical protein [Giesbergeria anulus]SER38945.1 hypothetical protein SAMN02982919_02329 [Giesbergeria anulus]
MKAHYLEISAEVSYWEDANVNGVDDIHGTLIPLREGNLWAPIIRLSDGVILNWPHGISAEIDFKVRDAGEYWLLDEDKKRIAKWSGSYVPDVLLDHSNSAFDDYITLSIDTTGTIENWCEPVIPIRDPGAPDPKIRWVSI